MKYPGRDWSVWASSWPHDRPRPTEEEWDAAWKRWRAEGDRHPDDHSDGACDFGYLLTTYAPWCWLRYFFPDEPITPPALWVKYP